MTLLHPLSGDMSRSPFPERRAAEFLRRHAITAGHSGVFHTAIILGSGLGCVGDVVAAQQGLTIDYCDVPGLPQPAVEGHAGRIIIGRNQWDGVIVLQGRVHLYEGYSAEAVCFATRVLCECGVRRIAITNAAGGIRETFQTGDLMLIDGHLQLTPAGCPERNDQSLAPSRRNCPVWSPSLLSMAKSVVTDLKVHQGVYALMPGPNYETPAEVRMLKTLGADAVGMSTIPEALTASRRGARVLGISCITNDAAGLGDQPLNHQDVGQAVAKIEDSFASWMLELTDRLKTG